MTLQQIAIQQIGAYGGRRKFITELKKYAKTFIERRNLENLIRYINLLHKVEVNIEEDCVLYFKEFSEFHSFIKQLSLRHKSAVLTLVYELATVCINHAANIRSLNQSA